MFNKNLQTFTKNTRKEALYLKSNNVEVAT